MLIQFNSDYTPTGTINLKQSIDYFKQALASGANPRLLIADINSLLAAPDFEELCLKEGVSEFSIGSKIVVESEFGHSTITMVAKNNDGVKSIARLLSKIPGNLSSPSNHKFSLDDLAGCSESVEFLADETFPSFLALTHGDKSKAKAVREKLTSVGVANYTLKGYNYDASVYEKNKKLASYKELSDQNDSLPTVDLSLGNTAEYTLAKARFEKVTGDVDGAQNFFQLKSCADKASFVPTESDVSVKDFFASHEQVSYAMEEKLPYIGDKYDSLDVAKRKILDKFPEGSPEREVKLARHQHESEIVNHMGYKNYFDLSCGFGAYLKERKIPVISRGSGGSSELVHENNLTPEELDPIKLNLDLRRFIGYHRKDNQADLDIEVPNGYTHLFEEYVDSLDIGATTSMISVLEKYSKFKSTLNFVVKTLGVSEGVESNLNKKLFKVLEKSGHVSSWNDYKKISISAFQSAEVSKLVKFTAEERKLLTGAIMMKGWGRNLKNHPSKKIISIDNSPMFPTTDKDGALVSHISKDNCERLGQTPFDILSSKIATGLMKADRFIESVGLPPVSIHGAFSEDNKYFNDLFDKLPNSYNMITQLSSDYASKILKENAPKNYQDLAMVFALIRPAVDETEEEEQTDEYLLNDSGDKSDPLKSDDAVQNILKRTRGEFIYDEQILEIATQVANLSDEQGDKLRTAIRKTKPELIDSLRQPFIDGAVANGRSEEFATALYSRVSGYMGKYFFNESHAMSYAAIALKQMVLKDKYPSLFYQFCVKEHEYSEKNKTRYSVADDVSLSTKQDAILHGVKEFQGLGYNFQKPSVNKSKMDVFWSDGLDRRSIVPSLRSTGVSNDFAKALVKVRRQNRENGGINDVVEMLDMLNYEMKTPRGAHFEHIKADMMTLAKVGALDELPIANDLNLDSIVEPAIKRGILVKFIGQYQQNAANPSAAQGIELQVNQSDILNKKELIETELKCFGYSPSVGFKVNPPKENYAHRRTQSAGLKS
ncbi:hypothetical protein [Vibrio crassostreae]|uniref:hypothetical protein n=1 Tax=Vibrio crassostreae TaxID=246167 RepID=UPI001B314FF3|nr:hypothetical protein [Vibrio crassostreae]